MYEDGSVCAIAASFPIDLLRQVVADDAAGLNWLMLKRVGYFDVDCVDTVEVLTALQLGYDFCCVSDGRVRNERTANYAAAILSLEWDIHACFAFRSRHSSSASARQLRVISVVSPMSSLRPLIL